jgi:hypothetical protein
MASILHGSNSCAREIDEHRQNAMLRPVAMACNFDMHVPLRGSISYAPKIDQESRAVDKIISVTVEVKVIEALSRNGRSGQTGSYAKDRIVSG